MREKNRQKNAPHASIQENIMSQSACALRKAASATIKRGKTKCQK